MIERQIVAANTKELEIQEYITSTLKNLGQSHIKLQRTPLGEKIIIHASRPGLIVGRKGANIKNLTDQLKEKFKLENPQIEINEVTAPDLDAQIVAERIASSLEKFGTQRFKGIGHKVMSDVMNAGALGIEILVSGKIPSSRARRWRFYQGYLKKCGDVAIEGVRKAYTVARLKTGVVGIQVRIMPPDVILPDKVTLPEQESEAKQTSEKKEEKKPKKTEKKEDAPEKSEKKEEKPKRKTSTKKPKKEEEASSGTSTESEAQPQEQKEAKPAAKPAENPIQTEETKETIPEENTKSK